MSITTIRLLSAIALFALTIVAGALPPVVFSIWRNRKQGSVLTITGVDKKKKNKKWCSYNNILKVLMFFGGGILLATCFIHLIPEVRQNLDHFFQHRQASALTGGHSHSHAHSDGDHDHEELRNGTKGNETDDDHDHDHHHHHHHNESEVSVPVLGSDDHGESGKGHEGHSHGIPYVELAVCLGFFVIYLLEELVHTFIGCNHEDGDDLMTDEVSSTSSFAPPAAPLSMNRARTLASTPAPDFAVTADKKAAVDQSAGHDNFAIDLKSESASVEDLPASHPPLYTSGSSDALVHPSSDFKRSDQPQSKFLQPPSVRFIQGLVVIIAFSAHSIFDGVAIGLQEESTSLWTMFFAICSHKLVVALAVGKYFDQSMTNNNINDRFYCRGIRNGSI